MSDLPLGIPVSSSALHPAQENIFFEQILCPQSPMYNLGVLTTCAQDYDSQILEQAWCLLYQNLDALRCVIQQPGDGDGQPQQTFEAASARPKRIEQLDFSDQLKPKVQADAWIQTQVDTCMDYLGGEASRVALIQLAPKQSLIYLQMHHVIVDAIGIYQLLQWLERLYVCCRDGLPKDWLFQAPQYLPAVKKSRSYLDSQRYQQDKTYWQRFLTEHKSYRLMPRTFESKAKNSNASEQGAISEPKQGAGELISPLPDKLIGKLQIFCHQYNLSPLTVLTSLVAMHFSGQSLQESMTFATTVHGRQGKKGMSVVGMHSNVLPFSFDLDLSDTFLALTSSVGKGLREGFRRSHFPSSHLSRLAGEGAQVLPDVQIMHEALEGLSTNDTPVKITKLRGQREPQPLLVKWLDYHEEGDLALSFTYAYRYFSDADITSVNQRLLYMLERCLTAPETRLINVDVLPEAERHTLLQVNDTSDTSDTRVPYSDNTTLQKLFEAQVEKTPDASALVFEQSHLSYRELNDCANRLALDIRVNYLERHGQIMLADTLIAVYLDRGLEMVISILAILKAGAAYVPISPEYPQERVQFIIEDTQAPILLSEQGYIAALDVCLNELTGDSPSLIPLDVVDLRKRCEAQSNQSNIPPINHAHHLAYVIYTSGTTGKPKGVMVTHQNVIHMAQAHLARFNLRECKRSLLFFPYVFDASVFELFTSLLGGLTAYICSENERKSLVAIEAIIARERIEFAALPPALLSAMSSSAQQESFNSLKVLFLGGESPSAEVLKFFSQHCQVFNAYGPTEITVCASVNRYQEGDLATNIGQALDNCHLYVLDGVGRLAPLGVPGELYVGGAGVTRGYLNRSDLTQERFVNNPFATRQDVAKGNTRLYKTGDLVRWITGAGSQRGSLEYLGRNDQQVKIRGHRIELGEVESALNNLPHVAQSVVIDVSHNGSLYLAAYIVGEPSAVSDDELSSDNLNPDNLNPDNLNVDNLNNKLSENLPDYMLPSTYTLIDTVPLTLNGKVNRRELPLPEFVLSTEYLAPKSELEKSLCVIWQEVLQRNKIGVNDNLFRIGGDSITAIRITAKIRRDLDADIELAQLFSQPTVAAIAGLISALAASGVRAEHELTNIPALALTRYPLSFAQERLLFVEQFEQGSSAYHIPFLTQLRDGVNLTLIEAAFNVIAERHPILKSVYRTDEHSQFYQEALSSKLSLRVQSVDNESALLSAVAQDISQPFDLSNEASMRLYLYSQKQEPQEQESQKQEPQEQESQGQDQQGQTHTLLVLWHHIAFDGWSMECFIQEFAQTYSDLCKAQPVALPELEISYGDYASWQRQNLAGDYLAKLTHYWKGQLCAYEPLSLPVDYARPAQQDYRGKNCYFALDRELSDNIRAFAKQQNTTLYTVLLSGFYLTLSKISGQNDILLGTPSDNRQHPQTQSLIGFFVNTLVLRAQLQPQASIEALVQQVHQLVIQAKAHQEMPFEKLVDALDLERDASRHPLYQVMFSVLGRNHDRDAMLDSPEWPFEQGELENNQDLYSPAKFDLSVYVNEGATQHPDSDKHCISGRFNYALSLFDDATISRMAAIYQRVLKAFVDPQCQDLCLSEVDVLSAEQRASLLNQPEELDYPHEATLHQLFEEQAENTPYATALVFERSEVFKCTSLSYRELNEKANQLAHEIRASYSRMFNKALPVDSFIGLYMDRSPEMVVGMLAILKAGAAYVPISPDYPEERVRYMLEDTQCSQVLSAGHLLQALEDKLNIKIQDGLELGLDPGLLQGLKNGLPQLLDVGDLVRHSDLGNTEVKPNNENPKNINHCTDLAYVLYTSGATGKPKGVLTPHRGVTSLVKNNTYATLSENDVFLQLSNPNFDATTLEVWSALLNGARLVVAPSKLSLSVESLHGLLSDYHVSVLWLTRALFDSLYVQKSDLFANLRYLLVGGEALTPSLIRQLVAQKDRPKHIINGYGSTESTTFTTTYDCDQFASLNIVNVPLGKAINTRQLYVLNTDMQLVPPGTPGELYVAGAGLARGYLNRPELTQERFVPNPFATEADKAKAYTNLYKTGDIVRYLVDANGFPGDLEYLGRNDSQVKIRGYRIELGEIENALNQLASVEHAAVIEREQAGSAYLAAYVVMQAGQVFDSEGLSQHLSLSLPDYMLPSTLTCLDALPLTINGKLDRRALPAPELVEQEKYTAPTSILEKTLCAIWQKVLSLPKIGLNDNFFRIGGNSISAIRLTAAIRSELKVDVTLAQLFSRPSVAGLCACLEEQSLDHKVL
ncbi:MAG: non-ribosomal peptide synthetase, partial [Alteromonadaceae bacterium]